MRRLLLVFVIVFIGAGSLCGCDGCPPKHGYSHGDEYRRAELADRQKKAEPVTDALKRYSIDHGKYPERLDDLVAARHIDGLPDLTDKTDHQGKPHRLRIGCCLARAPGRGRAHRRAYRHASLGACVPASRCDAPCQ